MLSFSSSPNTGSIVLDPLLVGTSERMELADVSILTSSTVFPPRREAFKLSPLDECLGFASYQKRVLFFPAAPQDAASQLKQSLAKVLAHFYPIAGRVCLKDGFRIECEADTWGVAFIEAFTDATVQDLGDFLPSEFCDNLCQMEVNPLWPWRAEYPLLAVQVTRFSCGGLSVGAYFSHQLFDGPTFWYFMNSWSEIARTGSLTLEPDTSFKLPFRTDLDKDKRQKDVEELGYGLVRRSDFLDLIRRTGWKSTSESLGLQKLKFTKENLARLKSLAPGFTTFEVLCAYLWKRMSMSWGMSGTEPAILYPLLNLRGKLKGVKKNYAGNAILAKQVVTTVGELEKSSLSAIADMLHAAIRSVTEDKIESLVSFLYENRGDDPEFQTGFKPMPGISTIVVSSPRHPIYETDFGWGRPSGTAFGANDLAHSKLFLLPCASGDGAIEAIVSLNRESMDIFSSQEFGL